jgi:hypothetical protein
MLSRGQGHRIMKHLSQLHFPSQPMRFCEVHRPNFYESFQVSFLQSFKTYINQKLSFQGHYIPHFSI